jgi:hypothetical protein
MQQHEGAEKEEHIKSEINQISKTLEDLSKKIDTLKK